MVKAYPVATFHLYYGAMLTINELPDTDELNFEVLDETGDRVYYGFFKNPDRVRRILKR